mmetsp:Transcript_61602/g.101772  ORF Transcript_61602/g.101772 Transcript_61602/m.101772 type:complete len:81 (-) Transcript_61602:1153-1395(-)
MRGRWALSASYRSSSSAAAQTEKADMGYQWPHMLKRCWQSKHRWMAGPVLATTGNRFQSLCPVSKRVAKSLFGRFLCVSE